MSFVRLPGRTDPTPAVTTPVKVDIGRRIGIVTQLVSYRMRIVGAERIPADGPVLFVINHSSGLDGPVLFGVLPRRVSFLVKAEMFRGPVGWVLTNVGQYGLHRDIPDRAPLLNALAQLQAGGAIGIFPEGTRGFAADPQPFKSGLYTLAQRFPQVVLVPAWINNIQRVMPKGEVIPVPVLCSVTFGAPIEVGPGEERRAFLDRARDAVIALREV